MTNLSYYAHISPENLVAWAVTAMKNSYSPQSGHKEGVLIRTNSGDISVGTNVETINYDGLTAVAVAIGQLFVRQPWVGHGNAPEKITDVIYALEDFNPDNPDSYVPNGHSLDWLRKFGSPDTVLHFSTPHGGIQATKTLHELLPYGPRMKPLREYLEGTRGFFSHLIEQQKRPENIDTQTWHDLRRSRLHAFAPYSTYRVGTLLEADPLPMTQSMKDELIRAFDTARLDDQGRKNLLQHISNRRQRFPGINVELSGNEGLHGEGCAIGGMITELGPQAKISKLYLQGGFKDAVENCTMCGKCRQFVQEFSTEETVIMTVAEHEALPAMPERHFLPGAFAKLE